MALPALGRTPVGGWPTIPTATVWAKSEPHRPAAAGTSSKRSPARAATCSRRRGNCAAGFSSKARARVRLQRDLFAGPAGAVHGVYDLQRVVAFFAGDQGRAAGANGLSEVQELALEGLQRDGHGVGGAGGHLAVYGRGLAGIVFHVPGGQLVAGDDGGALSAVELGALGVAGPEGGGRLDHAGRAVAVAHHGVHHVLGFDLVQAAELPVAE